MEEYGIKIAIDLINLYQTQQAAEDRLQNYFSVVTLAILSFTIGSDKPTKSFKEALVIIIGYLFFCVGNFSAIMHSHRQLIEFALLAQELSTEKGIKIGQLVASEISSVRHFYQSIVISVSGGILFTTWKKNRKILAPRNIVNKYNNWRKKE